MAKNNNSNILVSVIVPIYNVEKYLSKCIDSIVNQKHTKLEIILVDDESPDNCSRICDRYAVDDDRVRVIHKINGGLSDARNAGLSVSKGVYVVFVDGDDYIDEDFVKLLLDEAIQKKADISVCSYSKVYQNKIIPKTKSVNSAIFTNIQAMRDLFIFPSLCEVVTWNKLYKKSLFDNNDIVFPVGRIHEDNFTTYKLFYYATKVVFLDMPLYFYTQRIESIMNDVFNKKSWDIIDASYQAVEWVKYHKLPLTNEVLSYQLAVAVNLLNTMIDKRANDKDIWRDLTSWIANNKTILYENSCISNKQKFLIFILKFGKVPYVLLRYTYTFQRIKI